MSRSRNWFTSGKLVSRLGPSHRHVDRGDVGRGDDGVVRRSRLLDRLHGRRPVAAAFLRLPLAVHLRHADAGDGGQSGSDVLRLGRRRPDVLPAGRLLVRAPFRQCSSDQGVRRQPGGRLWLFARHLPDLLSDWFGRLRSGVRRRARVLPARRCILSASIGTRSRSPACSCSWGRWASRRSSCCTPGCRTRWKARLRFRLSFMRRPW